MNNTLTNRMPKVISPGMHAVLDYVTAGTFFVLGAMLMRRHTRAAGLAFTNGAAVLGTSLMTDYPGGVWRVISFETHGMIDAVQAGMSALGPRLLGFENEPEARAFHAQAALESGVIAATDWTGMGLQRA
jgi:hypothetical protein